jgi:hypothetical protein
MRALLENPNTYGRCRRARPFCKCEWRNRDTPTKPDLKSGSEAGFPQQPWYESEAHMRALCCPFGSVASRLHRAS